MSNGILQFDYDVIKVALFNALKGQTPGKFYWGDGEGWVEFSREPGGYYLAILSTGGITLNFRYRYQDIEGEGIQQSNGCRPALDSEWIFAPESKPFNPLEHEQCK